MGAYAITPSAETLASDIGYGFQYQNGTLSVTPRGLSVSADALNRVYGEANPALTYTVGGAGLVNGDTLTGGLTTAATATSSVGGYAITQGTLGASPNYALSYTGNTLSVTPRQLTKLPSLLSPILKTHFDFAFDAIPSPLAKPQPYELLERFLSILPQVPDLLRDEGDSRATSSAR